VSDLQILMGLYAGCSVVSAIACTFLAFRVNEGLRGMDRVVNTLEQIRQAIRHHP
jgi:hypothetical protein